MASLFEDKELKVKGPMARLASCVVGMTPTQVKAIVDKYMIEHPEQWHYEMSMIVFFAILFTCPVEP